LFRTGNQLAKAIEIQNKKLSDLKAEISSFEADVKVREEGFARKIGEQESRAEKAEESIIKWRNMSVETYEAMVAMRNQINEYIPMPSIESDLLQGPESSVFCKVVADNVCDWVNKND